MHRPNGLLVALILLFPGLALAGSSNSLLDISPDGKQLLAANADNGTVTVVDLATRQPVREIEVGDKPEGVTWIGNGPLAAVTVYREDTVVFFDASSGKIVKKLAVADEPYGIIANKAGTTAWVTHEYPGSISEIDLKAMKVVKEHKIAAAPPPGPAGLKIGTASKGDEPSSFLRGIALSADEKTLYVAEFYTAALHAVDRQTGQVLDTWTGHDVDNLCRHVALHPNRPKAFLSHVRSRVHVIDGSGSIFPQVSICDLVPQKEERRRKSIGMDTYNSLHVVTNPWETAFSPDGKTVYTVYLATNDMNVSRFLDDNYREIEPIGGAVRVGQQPRAVRVSPDGKEVYIYNTLDFEVGVHDASMKKLASIKVCPPAKTPEWVRGKALFGMALPPMTNPRWVSCFSCHPDGQSDGRVWQNPEGLRKVPSLFGLAHTHPLHWSADRDESQDFEYTIRSRLMRGGGLVAGALKPKQGFTPIELSETMAGRSKDLDALAIYTNSFEVTTLSPHIVAPGKLSESAERGKALFLSKDTNCASCHSGPYFTDSTLTKPFKVHDVGTGGSDPSEKMGPNYDTPSLFFAYRTAPYLHHGKAKTLKDVLTTQNQGDKHGKTSHLKPNEIDDLVSFLKSLPYELPPLETANTVKDRVPIKK